MSTSESNKLLVDFHRCASPFSGGSLLFGVNTNLYQWDGLIIPESTLQTLEPAFPRFASAGLRGKFSVTEGPETAPTLGVGSWKVRNPHSESLKVVLLWNILIGLLDGIDFKPIYLKCSFQDVRQNEIREPPVHQN